MCLILKYERYILIAIMWSCENTWEQVIHFDIIETSYITLYVQRKTYENIDSIVWGTKGSSVIT
jgi:hypothetical protein